MIIKNKAQLGTIYCNLLHINIIAALSAVSRESIYSQMIRNKRTVECKLQYPFLIDQPAKFRNVSRRITLSAPTHKIRIANKKIITGPAIEFIWVEIVLCHRGDKIWAFNGVVNEMVIA